MAAELYGAEYWVRENRLRRALNAELRRLSARTDEEAYAALLSLSLFRRACTQTEQAAGSGHTEREIPAKALCAESAKAGKTEETERSGGFGCIGREKAAVTAEANLAEIGASV
ncbi:MAG TPA: hypothetical protein IAC57_03090 [Candidatus Scatosoma pullistercoris]|uniref:Uncharacterized protein n=1 Tax=Candidatus Scatosoma pullistercoris TaxID=2840934 RepID=A0A9D1MFD9_9FIRM|nr:hypothetical protein [Candidatus Scatosoma pullistercoris]